MSLIAIFSPLLPSPHPLPSIYAHQQNIKLKWQVKSNEKDWHVKQWKSSLTRNKKFEVRLSFFFIFFLSSSRQKFSLFLLHLKTLFIPFLMHLLITLGITCFFLYFSLSLSPRSVLFQKRYKRERRFRRRLEQELHHQHSRKISTSPLSLQSNSERIRGEMTNEATTGAVSSNNASAAAAAPAIASCNPVNSSPKHGGNGNNSNNNGQTSAPSSLNASSPVTSVPGNKCTSNVNISSTATNNSFTDDVNDDDVPEDESKASPVSSSPAAEEETDQPASVETTQTEGTE